jgi:glycosyltransferase involved in cell wall biosynthesis
MLSDVQEQLRVCFFGTYDSTYPGNSVLIAGLRRNGVEVVECHVPLWQNTPVKEARYFTPWSMLRLGARFIVASVQLLIRAARTPPCSVVVAGFNGYFDLPMARLVAWRWKSRLVFNPMMSLYDTLILDRQRFHEGSVGACVVQWAEIALYKLTDALLLDSSIHYRFFADYLHCPWSKLRLLPFGADDTLFYPRADTSEAGRFRVLFYGKYQPLQGVTFIVEAAKLLEDDPCIEFLLIGHGPTLSEVEQRIETLAIRNVRLVRWIDFDQLPAVIAESDVCLGIFGVSEKVDRCIANKVVQALAMQKPVITGYTQAMGQLFADRQHVIFCPRGDPRALADAVRMIKEDASLRKTVAHGGYEFFRKRLSPEAIGAQARIHLETLAAV